MSNLFFPKLKNKGPERRIFSDRASSMEFGRRSDVRTRDAYGPTKRTNLLALTDWCRSVGQKLLDVALDPEEVLRGTLVPQLIAERPKKVPIAIDWPDLFYTEPEQAFAFQINGQTVYRHEADLVLINAVESGPIEFAISSDAASLNLRYRLFDSNGSPDYSIEIVNGAEATVNFRSRTIPLAEFFDEEPPTFWFADGSSLLGIEYVQLRTQPEPFPRTYR